MNAVLKSYKIKSFLTSTFYEFSSRLLKLWFFLSFCSFLIAFTFSCWQKKTLSKQKLLHDLQKLFVFNRVVASINKSRSCSSICTFHSRNFRIRFHESNMEISVQLKNALRITAWTILVAVFGLNLLTKKTFPLFCVVQLSFHSRSFQIPKQKIV